MCLLVTQRGDAPLMLEGRRRRRPSSLLPRRSLLLSAQSAASCAACCGCTARPRCRCSLKPSHQHALAAFAAGPQPDRGSSGRFGGGFRSGRTRRCRLRRPAVVVRRPDRADLRWRIGSEVMRGRRQSRVPELGTAAALERVVPVKPPCGRQRREDDAIRKLQRGHARRRFVWRHQDREKRDQRYRAEIEVELRTTSRESGRGGNRMAAVTSSRPPSTPNRG